MRSPRLAPALIAIALVAAACGSDDDDASPATDAPVETEAPAATDPPATDPPATEPPATDPATEPVAAPASIEVADQSGDGATVSVVSVELPTDGFVVVHADDGGAPGPILGWSELLPAGTTTDVQVTLNEPLTESATVFPMAHVDANGNGVYEFMPPDVVIDVPAMTADGTVAVLPLSYTVDGAEGGDAAAAASIELATTDLGDILVDADGNTLYLFLPDAQGESTCYDDCEATWPVLTEVDGVGDGLDASLLGTTERTTGDVQATYNGWPLYYFAGDAAPGETNGQGVGDVWYVVDAAGDAVGL